MALWHVNQITDTFRKRNGVPQACIQHPCDCGIRACGIPAMTARQIKAFCSRSLHLNGLRSAINTADLHPHLTFAPFFFFFFMLCSVSPSNSINWTVWHKSMLLHLWHSIWNSHQRSRSTVILKVNCNIQNLLYNCSHTLCHLCHTESSPDFSGHWWKKKSQNMAAFTALARHKRTSNSMFWFQWLWWIEYHQSASVLFLCYCLKMGKKYKYAYNFSAILNMWWWTQTP